MMGETLHAVWELGGGEKAWELSWSLAVKKSNWLGEEQRKLHNNLTGKKSRQTKKTDYYMGILFARVETKADHRDIVHLFYIHSKFRRHSLAETWVYCLNEYSVDMRP